MRVVVGIPVFNEMGFIDMNVSNMLTIGFDDIVYLDDCSTDGSYEKLLEYSKKHSNIHVFKNEANSIACKTVNRWKTLAELCRGFEPDWIMVRAVDQELSFPAANGGLKAQLGFIFENKPQINIICFPVVHLWRSVWWYRSDLEWGHSALNSISNSCWRNDANWEFKGDSVKTGMHRGCHMPNYFEKKAISFSINHNLEGVPIAVMHYGMCSHENLAKKLDFQMSIAKKIGGGNGLPVPDCLPDPSLWRKLNGYKIAHEFNMALSKVKDVWYSEPVPDVPKPKIESLYPIISKYNTKAADRYKELFNKTFGY